MTIYKFMSPRRKAQIRKALGLIGVLLIISFIGLKNTYSALIDDFDSIYPVACGSNSVPNASGCSSFGTSLYTYLASGENSAEETEYQEQNFVVPAGTYPWATVPANSCLGATAAGLTHTPGACYAYNRNIRATETGAITYANNSTCWVAIDENRTGSNAGLTNFSRVGSTHYLMDCIDALTPVMPLDAQLLMRVTTSGGSIISVTDLRNFSPFTPPLNGSAALVNSIGCIGTHCSINGFSVNGMLNIQAYGAVSSTSQPLCTGTAGSSVISCSGGSPDFVVGQNITLNHAGATVTIAAPTATVSSVKWATPAVNSTIADGTGATNATYLLGALTGFGGIKMAASAVSIANSQASLNFNAFNKIAFTPTGGGSGTVICGCVGNACTLTPMGVVPQDLNFYYDFGSATTGTEFGTSSDSSTLCTPGASFNDNDNDTIATVSSGLPTSLTHNLTNSVTNQPLFHDNSVGINAAYSAICSGGSAYMPVGTYTLGQTVGMKDCRGVHVEGTAGGFGYGTTLLWWGPLGGTAFYPNCLQDSKFENFTVDDKNGNTPSYGIRQGNESCAVVNSTNVDYSNIDIGESGYGFYVSGTANNSPLTGHQIKFLNGGIANLAINNAQSKNDSWWGTNEARRLYGFYQIASGAQFFYGRQGNGWIQNWLTSNIDFSDSFNEGEQPARWLVTGGPSSATGTVAFYSAHLSQNVTTLPTDGIAFSDSFNSPLLLSGNNFTGGGGLPQTAWCIYANNSTHNGAPAVLSYGNAYTNTTPFSCLNSGNTASSHGDRGANGSGVQVAIPEIDGTQVYYNAAANAIPACSSIYARQSYCVSDETSACTPGNTYASGGANSCRVQCNTGGTAWKVTGTACY